MKPIRSSFDAVPTSLHIGQAPQSLRLPAGSAIMAVRGEVWITQERMRDDIVIGPGQWFDVRSDELLVINATREPADLFVARPASARQHADRDVYALARCRAARLRREAIERLFAGLEAGVRSALARLRSAWQRPRASPT
jgi:hypothetical protein